MASSIFGEVSESRPPFSLMDLIREKFAPSASRRGLITLEKEFSAFWTITLHGGIGSALGSARPVVSAAMIAWDKYDFPAVESPCSRFTVPAKM